MKPLPLTLPRAAGASALPCALDGDGRLVPLATVANPVSRASVSRTPAILPTDLTRSCLVAHGVGDIARRAYRQTCLFRCCNRTLTGEQAEANRTRTISRIGWHPPEAANAGAYTPVPPAQLTSAARATGRRGLCWHLRLIAAVCRHLDRQLLRLADRAAMARGWAIIRMNGLPD
jgi:hypothetical protein